MTREELKKEWFKVIVALIGVVVTAILGISQYHLTKSVEESSSIRGVDAIEVQMIQVVSDQLAILAQDCPPAPAALRLVSAAGQYLGDTHKRFGLSNMGGQLVERCSSDMSPSMDPSRSSATLRLQEARVPALPSANWYTVIASLPGNDEEKALAEAEKFKERALSKQFEQSVSLYKTKISNNYAVVMGGDQSRSEALSLADQVRTSGLVKDAFAQKDREWKFVRELSN